MYWDTNKRKAYSHDKNSNYVAFAHPYFLYCNHVWGNTCVTSLDTISKQQNKLVRIIYNSEYDANTEIIYKKFKIMKFININKFQIANYMYKYYHGLLPNYVNEMFLANNINHTYNTRYCNQLRIPKHNTNIIKYTISLARPKIWNSIAINIQNMSPVMFKQNVKTILNGEIVVD